MLQATTKNKPKAYMTKTFKPASETTIKIFQDLADFSYSVCKTRCSNMGSCCSVEYCEMAIVSAKEEYGVELNITSHPTLPLLDPITKSCTAAPHFRPLCALHQCDIAAVGYIKNHDDSLKENLAATTEYFKLYEQANEALGEEYASRTAID